ncbi:TerD family protein [Nocardia sp. NPDC003963]
MAVTLTWSAERTVDPQALLVITQAGKIRVDDDFVFYNAPRHPSGAVSLTEASAARTDMTVDEGISAACAALSEGIVETECLVEPRCAGPAAGACQRLRTPDSQGDNG